MKGEMKRKRRKWQKEEEEVPIEKTAIKVLYFEIEYSKYIYKKRKIIDVFVRTLKWILFFFLIFLILAIYVMEWESNAW